MIRQKRGILLDEVFLDSHLHLQMEEFNFKKDGDYYIERLRGKNIKILNIVGYDFISSKEVVEIKFPSDFEIYYFVGLHPHYASSYTDEDIDGIRLLLDKENVVGIGEIGIDLYWHKNDSLKEQMTLFERQLEIAEKRKKPVMLHVRNAYDKVLEIIKDYKDLRFEFHSFTGNRNELDSILSNGYFFGINGVITFKNNNLKDFLKPDDLERMILETDSPYLAPVPYRGRRNSPEYVIEVYKKVAEVTKISVESLKKIIKRNFYDFIGKKS